MSNRNMMSVPRFEAAVQTASRTFSDDFGVDVIFGGDVAETDG